jgi:hypothetical protein
MADCPVCQLHAESVFKVEGMDCHEESRFSSIG